jgi:molecular chaperone HscB
MNLADNDFVLFGLPERFALDRSELDTRRRQLQAHAHPDRFAAEGEAARRVAMQWSVRINEAYGRLRDPQARAAYLCTLRGAPVDAERNTAMPAAFLMQQMQWREALDEAADDAGALQSLDDEVGLLEQQTLREVATLLDDEGGPAAAAERVRALMFIGKFRRDLADRLEAITG